ncbi:MAG: hypothetical protein IKP33_03400 [Prevotella sp.]|jgi:hypothetical protein|nr:hypothetical protein [Prevotella sp.]
MKASEQTVQQIDRAIRKIADKFPPSEEATLLTDIHLRVNQDTGELLAYDDDDEEINRCVIDEWIDNKSDHFYQEIVPVIRKRIEQLSEITDHMSILKPYSFVLENDDKENIAELYVVDDDTVIIGSDLMEDLDKDLDNFIEKLLKE